MSKINASLNRAKMTKDDEFYTSIEDVQAEMGYYTEHFFGKTIFLNCDDPKESAFWEYFSLNFDFIGLKGLISTHYVNDLESEGPAYMLRYDAQAGTNEEKITKKYLKEDGDFRSDESIELLKEADIVITNPPFSLWNEYIGQLIEYKKDFIILGDANKANSVDIFPLIRDNKMWFGVTRDGNGSMWFRVPLSKLSLDKELGSGQKIVEGQLLQTIGSTAWFTNLPHKKRQQEMVMTRFYEGNEDNYPIYDNYKAIEVKPVATMPMDYKGVMGVPVGFLSKFNPDQFEIIGMDIDVHKGKLDDLKKSTWGGRFDRGYIDGKRKYGRLLVRNKKPISRKDKLGF